MTSAGTPLILFRKYLRKLAFSACNTPKIELLSHVVYLEATILECVHASIYKAQLA